MTKTLKFAAPGKLFLLIAFLLTTIACILGASKRFIELAQGLPVYPGARYEGDFTTSPPDAEPGAGISYTSEGSQSDILTFYLEEMPKKGWAVDKVSDHPDPNLSKIAVFTKDKVKCTILISTDVDQRRITIKISSQ